MSHNTFPFSFDLVSLLWNYFIGSQAILGMKQPEETSEAWELCMKCKYPCVIQHIKNLSGII